MPGRQPLAWLRGESAAKVVLGVIAVVYVTAHVAALFTESVNWDEFLLLQRAASSLATGELQTAGRPGLGPLVLLPFVNGCRETMATVTDARTLWALITLAALAALFLFLRDATRRGAEPWHAAALGTACIALVPVFMRWSLQVRTDQAAIAGVLWGGVALLASRKHAALALIAGVPTGIGYLFSQKALYVVALVGVVVLGDLFVERRVEWRREAMRLGGLVVGAAAVLVAYRLLVPLWYDVRAPVSVGRGLDIFGFYRMIIGFRVYRSMLPTLAPQLCVLALLVIATVKAVHARSRQLRPLLVSIAVILAGVAVGVFHAGAFPYFWMTLGLFPATAVALGWQGVRELLARTHVAASLALWGWLLVIAVPYRFETLEDTQRIQRESLGFVDRALPSSARGFHPDGALFCRNDPDPLPGFVAQTLAERFRGPERDQRIAEFMEEFRSRPVSFLVYTHRLGQFPQPIREMWRSNYILYYGTVALAGRRLAGPAGSRGEFELFVPGEYRWFAERPGRAVVLIDDTLVDRGDVITLAAGRHTAELTDGVGGALVLHVDAEPAPSSTSFHGRGPLAEVNGVRTDW